MSPASSSLSSSDVFLLLAPSGCWQWSGGCSSGAEAQGAARLSQMLQAAPEQVEEGEEPGEQQGGGGRG